MGNGCTDKKSNINFKSYSKRASAAIIHLCLLIPWYSTIKGAKHSTEPTRITLMMLLLRMVLRACKKCLLLLLLVFSSALIVILPMALLFVPVAAASPTSAAWVFDPVKKIQNDYRALTRRVTARQILLPPNSDTACLELKRSILRRLEDKKADDETPPEYIVDVFEDAAKKFSRDETTRDRGGLIGALVPQGTCRSAILDKACFEVPLGSLQGPIESEFGIHLLLVTERTNCPKLDGRNTQLVPTKASPAYGELVPSSGTTRSESQVTPSFLLEQAGFWAATIVAGGLVAELAARITG